MSPFVLRGWKRVQGAVCGVSPLQNPKQTFQEGGNYPDLFSFEVVKQDPIRVRNIPNWKISQLVKAWSLLLLLPFQISLVCGFSLSKEGSLENSSLEFTPSRNDCIIWWEVKGALIQGRLREIEMASQSRGDICYGNREKQMPHFSSQASLPKGLGKNPISHPQITGNNWPCAKLVPAPLFCWCTQGLHQEPSGPSGDTHVVPDEHFKNNAETQTPALYTHFLPSSA